MCLIPSIIHSYNEILRQIIYYSPSQSSHTILSIPHRCNFFIPKMHQKRPYSHLPNLLKTNKIIIIYLKHTFSLERFFSISHLGDVISVKKHPRASTRGWCSSKEDMSISPSYSDLTIKFIIQPLYNIICPFPHFVSSSC